MNTLEEFRSTLPVSRVAVEEWLDRQPAWFRNDPRWASSVYLLSSPPLVALSSMALKSVEEGWIRWDEILNRADATGDVEAALTRAAYELAKGDPGPALGLMLVFPGLTVLPSGTSRWWPPLPSFTNTRHSPRCKSLKAKAKGLAAPQPSQQHGLEHGRVPLGAQAAHEGRDLLRLEDPRYRARGRRLRADLRLDAMLV